MSEPTKEIEVELRDIGCPYEPLDQRAEAWLLGYKAGLASGQRIAMQAIRDEAAERRSVQ